MFSNSGRLKDFVFFRPVSYLLSIVLNFKDMFSFTVSHKHEDIEVVPVRENKLDVLLEVKILNLDMLRMMEEEPHGALLKYCDEHGQIEKVKPSKSENVLTFCIPKNRVRAESFAYSIVIFGCCIAERGNIVPTSKMEPDFSDVDDEKLDDQRSIPKSSPVTLALPMHSQKSRLIADHHDKVASANDEALLEKRRKQRLTTLRVTLQASLSVAKTGNDYKRQVQLPAEYSLNEWLAMHVMLFAEDAASAFNIICSEACTKDSCPQMSAGPRFQFFWAEDVPEPVELPANEYIRRLFEWLSVQISQLPDEEAGDFPKTFAAQMRKVYRRMFRIYAHIYHHHFELVVRMTAADFMDKKFTYLVFFIMEFNLMHKKELEPLQRLIDQLTSLKE
eukprot:TRINITY_DN13165_c0_g1_i1.p1 TRINITY_DN13165_c0_g1~~TRINITY_DN13165_c0_g1_i1.p1  ORF type:complete len:390 (+),score=95.27 TRINITY_DN13165_c0_g1_i1:486-1655(+)